MKTNLILLLLTTLTLLSCKKNNDAEFKTQILGEWKFARYKDSSRLGLDIPMPGIDVQGFEFLKNGICNNKAGNFREERLENEDSMRYYLGEETNYKIEDDSLRIYYPETKKWSSDKIFSITADTLILQVNDSAYCKYARVKYKPDINMSYDKIIVSSSGCYGSCPVADISIERRGIIFYRGTKFNTVNGFYTANISKEKYLQIEDKFNKVGISRLETKYFANHTDDETISVTFIKDDKIYKTISDYGGQSPVEFQWAYQPVRYLYQQLKLKQYSAGPAENLNWTANFENEKQVCYLTKSESFFLITKLSMGRPSNLKLNPKYTINYWDGEKKATVFTDGRYYAFSGKDKYKIIDLGYDFLQQNSLYRKFNNKADYN